tara:strand:+ start:1227 stop:1451 length:225 start_codon:yes stop_codon:yes gene_type:complete
VKIKTKLINLLENYDWYAFMSDDTSVDKRAQDQYKVIINLMKEFPNREEAYNLYMQNCPKGLAAPSIIRRDIGL